MITLVEEKFLLTEVDWKGMSERLKTASRQYSDAASATKEKNRWKFFVKSDPDADKLKAASKRANILSGLAAKKGSTFRKVFGPYKTPEETKAKLRDLKNIQHPERKEKMMSRMGKRLYSPEKKGEASSENKSATVPEVLKPIASTSKALVKV